MKRLNARNLLGIALACALTLISANLFAQARVPVHVPVGSPISAFSQIPSFPTGPLPSPDLPSPNPFLTVGASFDGIDFLGSNCNCLPPDTNAAVGNGFVAETVNVQFRVFNTSGTVLLNETLATLFGAASGGDPDIVYDEIANRWYVLAFDSSDAGLFLGLSNDSSPLDGFKTFHLTNVGGFPDYAKIGYNFDAIVISYNDFGSGGGNAAILAVDKAALLGGTLVTYNSVPRPQFRAMPPARMHGSGAGDPMWFVSTDGTDAGGNTMRVTKMTNVLSNSPSFTYTSLTVSRPYRNATTADQPGGAGTITTFPNTTTAQVQFRKGRLLTAMDSAIGVDGFRYPKGLFYVIDVTGPTPAFVKQGLINPGTGVAVQMMSIDQNSNTTPKFGMSWMESSLNEYVSMWVGSNGKLSRTKVAPGGGFMPQGFRIGDYSSTVLDPSDGVTFWSANEFVGPNGGSDIWSTHIASFKH